MYIHSATIENIRSIKKFNMKFDPHEYCGWHVIIGDNGAGKSTLVRAIALALIGPNEAAALRQNWADWLRQEETNGRIMLNIDHNPQYDKRTGKGKSITKYYIPARLLFIQSKLKRPPYVRMSVTRTKINAKFYIWGEGKGWFSASYGPFRRFTGGKKDYEKLFYSNPRLAPHLSVFGEDVALTECLDWIQTLHIKQLENHTEGQILDHVKTFINEGGLLPHNTLLDKVTADAVIFRDGNNCRVAIEQLSDGYRSVLSLTIELIRQLVRTYGPKKVFKEIKEGRMRINMPGVVLIDEIDAHMHPTWQRRVGMWFCQYFPKIQFLVATHSPLVCHAAEKGTVWRLPNPGTDFPGGRVKGIELDRLVFGNILEAYDTELFGQDVTRSESSKEKLERLAQLNIKSLHGKLSAKEKRELRELRAILPTATDAGYTSDGGNH